MVRLPENIKNYYKQFNADEKLAKKAYAERNKYGSRRDIFEPHSLPEDMLISFLEMIQPIIKDIDEVYLVKKKVKYVPEAPLYVILVKSRVPWYEIRLHNPKQQIGNYLAERLKGFFGIGTYVVTVDFPMYLKKSKIIPGALIYKRNKSK